MSRAFRVGLPAIPSRVFRVVLAAIQACLFDLFDLNQRTKQITLG